MVIQLALIAPSRLFYDLDASETRWVWFFVWFFLGAGAVALQCDSACEDADEASGQWEVYGGPTGPFRMDSRVCKAALVAGIIDRNGGAVSCFLWLVLPIGFTPVQTLPLMAR
jgi:hypothetical protein